MIWLTAVLPLLFALPRGCEAAVLQHLPICKEIQQAVSSSSGVYYTGHYLYAKGISHWASSSNEIAACVVEPGTPQDVGIILQIVGRTRTPFAVKGGGHATNPGASSTEGVQIAMSRFSEVQYDSSSQIAVVGAGLIWDDVYAALEPHGVNVVGGRVTGVGVAGFTLGGGYSWLTNERGLTVDTIEAYELVKPNGQVVTVNEGNDSELFFALKGGMNNFGIVTKFYLKTFPQGPVWGGLTLYGPTAFEGIRDATEVFSAQVTDPKASVITSFQALAGLPGIAVLMFYNAPNPPPGIFDGFMSVPHVSRNVKTRSFLDLVKSAPSNATYGQRGVFHTASVTGYGPNLLKAAVNETLFWSSALALGTGTFISYAMEPFLPSIYSYSARTTAFPFSRGAGFSPLNVYYGWVLPTHDVIFQQTIRRSIRQLELAAVADGNTDVQDAPLYPNYAIFGTSAERIYGQNLQLLRTVRNRVDPANVMTLAGGFKL